MRTTWLAGVAGAVAIGFGLAATPASAITFGTGGTCETGFTAVLGNETPLGVERACADTVDPGDEGVIRKTIESLSGDMANAANWSVMSGNYGSFSIGQSNAIFQSLLAGNTHEFGFADASAADATAADASQVVIFPNTQDASPGDSQVFTPTFDPLMFYATNTEGDQLGSFYTEAGFNVEEFEHFLILEGEFSSFGTSYLIFTEDLRTDDVTSALASAEVNADYNDAVVLVNPVPEPATLALFGAGLIGLGVARRRRKA